MTEIEPILVGQGLQFAEGIDFGRDGTLYCADAEGDSIWHMPPGGELQPWKGTGGQPNGARFGPDGQLFVADRGCRAILRFSIETGERAIYVDNWDGRPFQGPNDLVFGRDGTMYFTDPVNSTLGNPIGAVYAATPERSVIRVATDVTFPNGLAVTPDGGTLIVSDTHTGILHRYALDLAAGFPEDEPLIRLSPAGPPPNEAGVDGMRFGADGNLYVAHFGTGYIRAISPDGAIVASYRAGGPTPTNLAFWQGNLYVTEGRSGSIYRLELGVDEHPPFMRPW
jgi:sugar lactone lactonase YvrE